MAFKAPPGKNPEPNRTFTINDIPPTIKQIVRLIHENNFYEYGNLVKIAALENNSNFEQLFSLALGCGRAGKIDDALIIFIQLASIKNGDSRIFYNMGLLHTLKGNLDLAIEAYRKSLARKSDDIQTLTNMGGVLNDLNLYQDAHEILQNALDINQTYSETWSNLGISLNHLNLHAKAIDAYDEAIKINPQAHEVWLNRASAFSSIGEYQNALDSCEQSIALNPAQPNAWLCKASILENLQRYEEALLACEEVIKLHENSAKAWFASGGILNRLGRYDESLTAYKRAIDLKPDYAEAWNDRGCVLQEIFQTPQALNSYQKAIAINPRYVDAIYNQGIAFYELLHLEEAKDSFQSILTFEPSHIQAKLALALSEIPPILSTNTNIREIRARLSITLDDLTLWITKHKEGLALPEVGSHQLFYLAYQELNNKELLSKYGDICYKLMEFWREGNVPKLDPLPPKTHAKIRVGIVSSHIRNHSVWHALVKGWVENFDSKEFELHLFCLNSVTDSETELAKTKAASFTQHRDSLAGWIESIQTKEVDILIYPEIGMNEVATQLASLKISPLQMASWGHPETTGLPTIDHYISAADFEPTNSQNHYRESLITLPNLGCFYTKKIITPEPVDLDSLGICKSSTLLLCPGTPFKYAPSKDWVFAEIAKSLGSCQFIFFTDSKKWLSIALQQRLHAAFLAANLDHTDYLRFIPWQSPAKFYGLMQSADLFLDTIGFSGFNTAIQAIECDLPIVTQDGLFMRGRLASGILRRMSLDELITSNDRDYISLAVRLATDTGFNSHIRKQIQNNKSVLFNDLEPIRALENHLTNIFNALRGESNIHKTTQPLA